jgi:hypothetical protein
MNTETTTKIKRLLCGIATVVLTPLVYADKEMTVTPTGRTLTFASYPVNYPGYYGGQVKSFPIFTLSVAYQWGTNTLVSTATARVRPDYTKGSFLEPAMPSYSETLDSIVKKITDTTAVFSEADSLLDAAIREKRHVKIKMSDDMKTIKSIAAYNYTFYFGREEARK